MDSKTAVRLIRWLILVSLMILGVVLVGGITRLTESGLSIVDWRPFMGVVPPLTQQDWVELFSAYQAYPEYKVLRPDMTLSEFKTIYFWEYLHRLLGRLVGAVYALPLFYFLARKWISGRIAII